MFMSNIFVNPNRINQLFNIPIPIFFNIISVRLPLPLRGNVRSFRAAQAAPVNSIVRRLIMKFAHTLCLALLLFFGSGLRAGESEWVFTVLSRELSLNGDRFCGLTGTGTMNINNKTMNLSFNSETDNIHINIDFRRKKNKVIISRSGHNSDMVYMETFSTAKRSNLKLNCSKCNKSHYISLINCTNHSGALLNLVENIMCTD